MMWLKRFLLAIQIAFTYIGTVVGAGFASGQETLQFFTLFGSNGMWGIALCVVLFSVIGTRMMIMSHRLGVSSYQDFNRSIFGERWSFWINIFVGFSLFGITSVMMAGVGSLFQEQLGWPYHVGVIGTMLLSVLVLHRGMEGLISVNTYVVPIMFLFIMAVFFANWKIIRIDTIQSIEAISDGSWVLSSLSYVAFNLSLSQAVLIPLGSKIRDERCIWLGGWLAGAGLGLMLFVSNLVFLQNLGNVFHLNIPMAYIVSGLGKSVSVLFLFVVWGEIFTTLVGNIYGLTQSLADSLPFRRPAMIIVLFFMSYIFSLIGFPSLVGSVYPFLGYCGIVMMVGLFLRRVPAY